MLPWVATAIVIAIMLSRSITVLSLGDDDPWFTYAPLAIEKSLDEAIELLSNE